MAFDVQDTTYSGEYSSRFITRAMFSMDTVQKKAVHVEGDIKKLFTIGRLNVDNVLVPNAATPVDNGENPIVFDGRQIIPSNADLYKEYNPRSLEFNQIAPYLSTTILDREVPQVVQSQLVQLFLNRAGESCETMIWQGSKAYAGGATAPTDPRYQLQFFNGFFQRFVSDAAINLSSVSPVVITVSNVLVIMDDLIVQVATKKKALISNEKDQFKMTFKMSVVTCTLYQQALTTGTSFKGDDFSTNIVPNWKGYRVIRLAGFPDNSILFCRSSADTDSNLWFGMNSMKDWELKCMKLQANSELFFIQGKFKWDVQYGWSEEIFLYTTLTAANFLP